MSVVRTTSPRRSADAMTMASTTVAPPTSASASPAARARASPMGSTSSAARMDSRTSVRPRHHSATTAAGTVTACFRSLAARRRRNTRSRLRSSAMSAPVSSVMPSLKRPVVTHAGVVQGDHPAPPRGPRAPQARAAVRRDRRGASREPRCGVRVGCPPPRPRRGCPCGACEHAAAASEDPFHRSRC